MTTIIANPCHETPLSEPSGWPRKVDLFGVAVSVTSYEQAMEAVFRAVSENRPGIVSAQAVHAIISASQDPTHLQRVNTFDLVAPDGQPVRWAMNLLHGTKLSQRVYGPELMRKICQGAEKKNVSIYLYGGSEKTIQVLQVRLLESFPDLKIAGAESPPYRELTDHEDQAVIQRIKQSGAGIVFIGLGCPKQDIFAFDHRSSIRAVQVSVGAAFDFLAGSKEMAPLWMQRRGLEWVFRLYQEPQRLWRRYLVTNSIYCQKLLFAFCKFSQVRKQHQQTHNLRNQNKP